MLLASLSPSVVASSVPAQQLGGTELQVLPPAWCDTMAVQHLLYTPQNQRS